MTAQEDQDTFPEMKGGKAKFPVVGEDIYVQTAPAVGDYVMGGRAKVIRIKASFEGDPTKLNPKPTPTAIKEALIIIAEYPTIEFRWGDLQTKQYDLWEEFKSSRAHPSTPEELAKIREQTVARFAADRERGQRVRIAEMSARHVQRAPAPQTAPTPRPALQPAPRVIPPTHVLKIQPSGSEAWTHVGIAWKRSDGAFNIILNPGVTLSWKDAVRIVLAEPRT